MSSFLSTVWKCNVAAVSYYSYIIQCRSKSSEHFPEQILCSSLKVKCLFEWLLCLIYWFSCMKIALLVRKIKMIYFPQIITPFSVPCLPSTPHPSLRSSGSRTRAPFSQMSFFWLWNSHDLTRTDGARVSSSLPLAALQPMTTSAANRTIFRVEKYSLTIFPFSPCSLLTLL